MRYRITDQMNDNAVFTFDTKKHSEDDLLEFLGVAPRSAGTADAVALGDIFDALMLEPADVQGVEGQAEWLGVEIRPAWTRWV